MGRVPRNRGAVTTVLASLTPDGVGPTRTLAGGTTKDVFLAYLNEELGPPLAPGQMVVLDNLGAHRAAAVRDAVEARGATAALPAGLLARFQPDRTGLRHAQDRVAAGGERARGRAGDGDPDGARGHHPGPGPGLLCPLWLSRARSTFPATVMRN